MDYLKAFLCGGLLCAVGQIIIDKTKLTPARILVGYVTAGVILSAVGVYQPLADWAGAGATVPLTGFGHLLAKGVKNAVEHLKKERPEVIVAANISKNTSSINEDAAKDYETSFALLYDFVDMFVVNVSCPNVVGLTSLQDITFLSDIVDRLLDLRMYYDEYRPILLKVSPDLSHEQLDEIVEYCLRSGIDGIVAGNTTRSREGLNSISAEKIEAIGNGGMSGAPIYKKNLELVRYINTASEGKLPIIGVGGIMSGAQAQEMLNAGASLIEIYSGFIYEGPSLIKRIIKHLES